MESSYHPILHVEDDENDILLVKQAMGRAGILHPLQVAKNGERALDYLQGNEPFENREYYPLPCLILLDWNLPLYNGLEVLRWRQSQPGIRRIPVLVLTSSQETMDVMAAYDAGANGYLVKPADFNELVETMKAVQTFWLEKNIFTSPILPVNSFTEPNLVLSAV